MASGVQQIFTYNQVGTITNLLLPHTQNTQSGTRRRAYKHPPTDTYTHTPPTHTQKGRAIILIFYLWFWIKLFVNYTPWAPWTFLHISVFCGNVGHANGALPLAAEGPRYLKMAWKLSVHISVSKPFSNSLPFISKCQRQHTRAKKNPLHWACATPLWASSFTVDHITTAVSAFFKSFSSPLLTWQCETSVLGMIHRKNFQKGQFSVQLAEDGRLRTKAFSNISTQVLTWSSPDCGGRLERFLRGGHVGIYFNRPTSPSSHGAITSPLPVFWVGQPAQGHTMVFQTVWHTVFQQWREA